MVLKSISFKLTPPEVTTAFSTPSNPSTVMGKALTKVTILRRCSLVKLLPSVSGFIFVSSKIAGIIFGGTRPPRLFLICLFRPLLKSVNIFLSKATKSRSGYKSNSKETGAYLNNSVMFLLIFKTNGPLIPK